MSVVAKTVFRPGSTVFFFLAFTMSLACAEAPPGPLPASSSPDASAPVPGKPGAPSPDAPRTRKLAGTWHLNLDESDDPFKKLQQAHGAGGGHGGHHGGGSMGGGWPGGGGMGGGRGGMGGGGRGGSQDSDSEVQKMHLFVEPSRELEITQKEPEIDIIDDDTRSFSLYTDNRKLEKSKDATRQELLAKWEEFRLVAEGKDPRGNKYERCYEVLEGNQQLRETLFLKVGQNHTEVSIRYIYDFVPPGRPQPMRPQSSH